VEAVRAATGATQLVNGNTLINGNQRTSLRVSPPSADDPKTVAGVVQQHTETVTRLTRRLPLPSTNSHATYSISISCASGALNLPSPSASESVRIGRRTMKTFALVISHTVSSSTAGDQ
jgi:hypothetical protein